VGRGSQHLPDLAACSELGAGCQAILQGLLCSAAGSSVLLPQLPAPSTAPFVPAHPLCIGMRWFSLDRSRMRVHWPVKLHGRCLQQSTQEVGHGNTPLQLFCISWYWPPRVSDLLPSPRTLAQTLGSASWASGHAGPVHASPVPLGCLLSPAAALQPACMQ
jgi:hypothetical protein